MDVSLSELQELVMDREGLHAVIHGVTKSRTQMSDWTELILLIKYFPKYFDSKLSNLIINNYFVASIINYFIDKNQ